MEVKHWGSKAKANIGPVLSVLRRQSSSCNRNSDLIVFQLPENVVNKSSLHAYAFRLVVSLPNRIWPMDQTSLPWPIQKAYIDP